MGKIKLVMGEIVCIGPNDEDGIPYDEAVIHIDGDEDSEINVHCPNALSFADRIVKAVNKYDAMLDALQDIILLSGEKYAVERAVDGMRNVEGMQT